MKLGFNTKGKTTTSVLVGKLSNSIASTSRIFKYYNKSYSDLNTLFNHIFYNLSIQNQPQPEPQIFTPYHILNNNELSISELENNNNTQIVPVISSKSLKAPQTILTGPFTPSQIKAVYSINPISPIKGIRPVIITIITAFNNPYLVNDVKAFGTNSSKQAEQRAGSPNTEPEAKAKTTQQGEKRAGSSKNRSKKQTRKHKRHLSNQNKNH